MAASRKLTEEPRSGSQEVGGAAPAWHALPVETVLDRLGAGVDGLDTAEVAARRARYGPNRLPAARGRSALLRLLAQFHNMLIYVLLGSAAITAALGHGVDSVVILLVVLANAAVGFIQEGRAERALDSIRQMLTPQASTLRDGRRVTIPAEDLVPGDLVLLEAGDRVTADLRLVRARGLRVDEAVLTGESVPVDKTPAPVAANASLGDRHSAAFSGTLVTSGHGAGVVVETGAATELGRISTLLGSVAPPTTPLLRQMNLFARRLTVVILAGSALLFGFAVLAGGYGIEDAFLAMVGMAVAAIPEGLPAVLTITLAIGVQRMAARHAIVRRLPAVETLGSVSVIASDKTGTLTRNEMTVRRVATAAGLFDISGAGYEPQGSFAENGAATDPGAVPVLWDLTRAAALCNEATIRKTESGWVVDGDPMEGALVTLAGKAGHDVARLRRELPTVDAIPFDAAHRFMATLHRGQADGAFVCLKGAPEHVIAMCDRQHTGQGYGPIDAGFWHRQIDELASAGQRVLAVAIKEMPAGQSELGFADVQGGLVLIGLLGLMDPPREEAVAALCHCLAAGIRVKMITGDHAATARAIARLLGFANPDAVATGHDIDTLDDAGLRRLAREAEVFARTSPEHKLRLVEALQAEGAVIAMTGDGVNDAPALKRADVGVAMGRKGTEAAKEAAEMVLADDNFASIVAAVREGRTVYDNIQKVIAWTLPTNGGEALVIIAAILFGLILPITPVQILWINMVTAAALGLTLAFEPTEADAMSRPPRRPDEPILSGFLLWRVGLVSVLFLIGTFGMFEWASRRNLPIEEARTIVVNTIVVMEIFYLFSVRYLRMATFTWRAVLGTRPVLTGVAATTVLQFAFTYAPFMNFLFDTRPLALQDGLAVVAAGVALLATLEAEKLIRRRLGFGGAT